MKFRTRLVLVSLATVIFSSGAWAEDMPVTREEFQTAVKLLKQIASDVQELKQHLVGWQWFPGDMGAYVPGAEGPVPNTWYACMSDSQGSIYDCRREDLLKITPNWGAVLPGFNHPGQVE